MTKDEKSFMNIGLIFIALLLTLFILSCRDGPTEVSAIPQARFQAAKFRLCPTFPPLPPSDLCQEEFEPPEVKIGRFFINQVYFEQTDYVLGFLKWNTDFCFGGRELDNRCVAKVIIGPFDHGDNSVSLRLRLGEPIDYELKYLLIENDLVAADTSFILTGVEDDVEVPDSSAVRFDVAR